MFCCCLIRSTEIKGKKRGSLCVNIGEMAGRARGSKKTAGWRSSGDEREKMNLTYQNIRIRNAEVEDAALLCTWWNDGEVMAHAGFPLGLGISEEEITRKILTESDETTRRHIILINEKPVGEMNYRHLDETSCEMGIKICERTYQDQGFGTLILHMFLQGLFTIRNCEKVLLDTNLNNTRAQHVYEKLGFRKLRVNKDSWYDQLGKPQSSVDYELRREEYVCPLT